MIEDRINSLQLLHGDHFPRCRRRVDKRFEDYLAIQFAETGRLELDLGLGARVVCGPVFWFTAPGPVIRYHSISTQPWNHRYVAVTGALAWSWLAEGLCPHEVIPCPADQVAAVCRDFSRILAGPHTAAGIAALEKINLIENLVLKINAFRGLPRQTPLRDFVETTLAKESYRNPSYALWAERLNLAESTLRRRFREENGEPIHAFVQRLRINRARELLQDKSMSLSEVAARSGYSDEYYFNRHFRRNMGLTPGQFRRSVL